MAYDKFTTLTSTAYPLPTENVDTDQIIPARFLKATERVDFDVNFFRDWRYNQDVKNGAILQMEIIPELVIATHQIII